MLSYKVKLPAYLMLILCLLLSKVNAQGINTAYILQPFNGDPTISVTVTVHVLSSAGADVNYHLWGDCQTTDAYADHDSWVDEPEVYTDTCNICPGNYILTCETDGTFSDWNDGWIEIDGTEYCKNQGDGEGQSSLEEGHHEIDFCATNSLSYCPVWQEVISWTLVTNANGIGSQTIIPQECADGADKITVTVEGHMMGSTGSTVWKLWDICRTGDQFSVGGYSSMGIGYEDEPELYTHTCELCPGEYALFCDATGSSISGWNGGWITVDGVDYCKNQGYLCQQNPADSKDIGEIAWHKIELGCNGDDCFTWQEAPAQCGDESYNDENSYPTYCSDEVFEQTDPCGSSEVEGCMDSTANNYNADATVDNDSCTFDNNSESDSIDDVEGCTDVFADNYNADATVDDGSCITDSSSDDQVVIIPDDDLDDLFNGASQLSFAVLSLVGFLLF